MSIGALAFLNPWLLAGLATLPLIYWLLKTVPPRPKQVEFPATRILVGLENTEKTPAKTPWWLLLIRLAAAALVIIALAEPVLNPVRDRYLMYVGGADGYTDYPALGDQPSRPSSDSIVALDTGRVARSSRATSSAAPSTRTEFCQVTLARSAFDQPRSSSSAMRFG